MYDGDTRQFEKQQETKPDLSKPSVEGLSYLLRHSEEWPKHRWNFSRVCDKTDCGTVGCALGVAITKWPAEMSRELRPDDGYTEAFVRLTGMDQKAANGIFRNWNFIGEGYGKHNSQITELDVADKIDTYLAARKGA
jgi:hypothetical protein